MAPDSDKRARNPENSSLSAEINELNGLQEELQNYEERLKILFEFAPDAYYLNDLKGRFLDGNRAAEELIGYNRDELIGKSFLKLSLLPADQVAKAAKLLAVNALGKPTGPDEFVLNRKDGSQVMVEIRTYPVKIKGKSVVLGIARDITERKRAEEGLRQAHDELEKRVEERTKELLEANKKLKREVDERKRAGGALRESEERYRLHFENISDVAFSIDSQLRVLSASPAAERVLGYKTEKLIGKAFQDLNIVPPEYMEKAVSEAQQVLSGERITSSEYEFIAKDGARRFFEISGAPVVREGKVDALIAIARDTTKRKHAEQALRESEERYRTLVENAPIAVYRTTPGPNGKFLMANRTFLKMFGLKSMRELKQLSVADVYQHPADRELFSESLLEQGNVSQVELRLKRKDGTPLWGSVTARVVHDERDSLPYFDCTVMDITARKQAEKEKEKLEAQFRQAQKMEAIGTLAGGIAHDFNNLLMGILGNSSLMMYDMDSSHPLYERLKNIESLVHSGSKLTGQLLGYARKGRYEIKLIDLNQLVLETSEAFGRTRKEIMIHLELDEDLYAVEADQGQMEQILFNLYVNAADAMPDGGELTLRTTNTSHEEIKSRLFDASPGQYVRLVVKDTGIGMDKKTMQRIFDPFFTTKEMGRGTGLGLASTYGIVEGHGGHIEVDSREGRGTTMTIYLPATEKDIRRDETITEEPVKGKETILLVDDEEIVLEVGLKLLNGLGYRALAVSSGIEAIEVYEARKNEIAMVILDMIMPRMGGGETYDRLRGIDPTVKVMLSSGYSLDGQAKKILARGCQVFIQKPFTLKELSAKIRQILD